MPNSPNSALHLTAKQQYLLQVLYKFRFATARLLADLQNQKTTRVMLNRLSILVSQGYIGMNYDQSNKLLGKPATYYLLTPAIRWLRQQPFASPKVLNKLYYDRKEEEHTIQHCLSVLKAYATLKQQNSDQYQFYTKTELADRSYMPKYKPDAYLRDIKTKKEFLIDCINETDGYWYALKIIKKYVAYAESERWENATKRSLPPILLICSSEQLKRRSQRLIERELDKTYVEIDFIVETKLVLITG